MAACEIPQGWSFNPSEWSERLPVLGLALTGLGIATYLGLYQLDVVSVVWEPFFQNGSHRVLKESRIAHLLPIPDALLGALMYSIEAAVDVVGGRSRWRTMPWIVLLLGLIAAALGLGGIVLAILQPVLSHTFCTLCLASAVCSVSAAGFAMAEVLASLQFLKREHERGGSVWRALWGRQAADAMRDNGTVSSTVTGVS